MVPDLCPTTDKILTHLISRYQLPLTQQICDIIVSQRLQNPVFLLAGALLLDEKIHQSPALFWFGLWNDVILYLQAATQRPIDVSPAFMEYGLAKKIAA
jgi:hypothetical protein